MLGCGKKRRLLILLLLLLLWLLLGGIHRRAEEGCAGLFGREHVGVAVGRHVTETAASSTEDARRVLHVVGVVGVVDVCRVVVGV